MNLVFDLGNSQHKYAVYSNGKLIARHADEKFRPESVYAMIEQFPVQHSLVSSVDNGNEEFVKMVNALTECILLDHHTPLPIKNLYQTPETLGYDRLAGVIGARATFGNHDILVIDAGTCIKYDFINAAGEFLGGAISPGLMMRFTAMHNYTARLPLIPFEIIRQRPTINVTGDSTINSLLAGGAKGAVLEIQGFIAEYEKLYPGLKVVLTGGDAPFFELHLKREIFALPELVLFGLNTILEHNLKRT